MNMLRPLHNPFIIYRGEISMYTVVIADDEEEIRRSLIRKIEWEKIGFQIVGEAANGEDALELVEKYNPDLLLTDVKMPFISGIELARQVREIRPAIQIAFLSGYDDFSYAQQAIKYNIISYMLKPISSEDLTKELINIRTKIEEKFRQFASFYADTGKIEKTEFLMSLFMEEARSSNEELMSNIVECGILEKGHHESLTYAVIVTSILDENGENRTTRGMVNAVDSILKKYVKHTSVYIQGRVVSLLMATHTGFEKYLHILVEDICQNVKRIMEYDCFIGVSRIADELTGVHECYLEAIKAMEYADRETNPVRFIADLEQRKKSSQIICDHAVKIIMEQYMDANLSLIDVSSQIGVSPNYLSALLKKENGITFKDLLTKKRIEKAQELLLTSSMKIREIAETCGYNDQHYFSYCFKKYTGMSPNACRRKNEE